jgi:hypothetical protein
VRAALNTIPLTSSATRIALTISGDTGLVPNSKLRGRLDKLANRFGVLRVCRRLHRAI